jgi:hypothetical protein
MRAREIDAGPYEGAALGIDRGVVGMGDALDPAPESPEEAAELAAVTYGPKAARMLERFAELPAGTLVWARTGDDEYRLGRITGEWRYLDDPDARAVGIHHVRAAEWGPPLSRDAVPAAGAATFDRGGRNLQRINDADAERRSAELRR